MKRSRVLLDVDGVLADFTNAWLEIINKHTGLNISRDAVSDWDIFSVMTTHGVPDDDRLMIEKLCQEETGREGFCRNLTILPGAQDGVAQLREIAEIYIVTSPWNSRHWMYERDEWLKSHFHVDRKHIVHTDAKYLIRGDFLIDDKTEHIKKWCASNWDGHGILWSSSYNKEHELPSNGSRATSWNDVIKVVHDLG